MRITGLITEYNPFHNGHLYHMEKAKEITKADAVIAIMSGNFVQRGAPAIMPKHLRAEAALKAGVSVVIELPVCYSTGSAEYFAAGAVSLFEKLGCVGAVCFGSECGDLEALKKIARITFDEPDKYKTALQANLKNGASFPRARQAALKRCLEDDSLKFIIEQPNNILGIEYIKTLYQKNSSIEIYTIKRKASNYHDQALSQEYSSASAVRSLLRHAGSSVHLETENRFDEPAMSEVLTRLEGHVPLACIRLLEETYRVRYPVYSNDFSLLLKYKLMTETQETLARYFDVSEELANRIHKHANQLISFKQFCELLKSRNLTYTRISRALFHILLGIKKTDMEAYERHGDCQYARILGFRKDASHILTHLKAHSSVPLITKLTQTERLTPAGIQMLEQDIFSSNLYESVITDKYKSTFIHECQQPLVII